MPDKKTLILYDSVEFFIPYMESENIEVSRLYKKRNFLITIIKKFFFSINRYAPFWYEDWHKKINSYDKVIIFASKEYTFIRKIKETNPSVDIIFWYWNPVFRVSIPKKELYSLASLWSFDKNDCQKYNMNYNTTFYFENIKLEAKPFKYDNLFVGINKGRRKILDDLEKKLKEKGFENYFYIVPDPNETNVADNKPINYKEYLNLLAASTCIIDILPVGQSGQTLRPMESIFFKKKLITNDVHVKQEDFYDRNNIFILGEDNFDEIENFITSPYQEVNTEIIKYYDFKNWLKRFDK